MNQATVITLLSFLFAFLTVVLGLIIRITVRWTRIEEALKYIAEKFGTNGNEHAALGERIDRTDARLERHEEWHRRGHDNG